MLNIIFWSSYLEFCSALWLWSCQWNDFLRVVDGWLLQVIWESGTSESVEGKALSLDVHRMLSINRRKQHSIKNS